MVVFVCIAGCGRLGYDERRSDAAAEVVDVGSIDAPLDGASIDGPAVCPVGSAEIAVGSTVCIELAQRGTLTWTNAKADCEAINRRLCADLEWYAGCLNTPGIMDLFINYEWVAEEAGGVALKRGGAAPCETMSSHEIFVDPYGYRCCVDK